MSRTADDSRDEGALVGTNESATGSVASWCAIGDRRSGKHCSCGETDEGTISGDVGRGGVAFPRTTPVAAKRSGGGEMEAVREGLGDGEGKGSSGL